MERSRPGQDYVDGLIGVLSSRHDDDVLRAKALAYRLRRIAHRLETEIKRDLAGHGVELWELELLACLIRTTPVHRLSAGALMAQMQLTSGAVTNRVTRMEAKGWITRALDPDDRRSVLVELTAEGRKRALQVFAIKTEAEVDLLAALSPARQRRLNDDLRSLLLTLEDPA